MLGVLFYLSLIWLVLYVLIVPSHTSKIRQIEYEDFVENNKSSFKAKDLELYNSVSSISRISGKDDAYTFKFLGKPMSCQITRHTIHIFSDNMYLNDLWDKNQLDLISKILEHKIRCQF